jgi:eukaryotic-like serine/threonine-protein kinase
MGGAEPRRGAIRTPLHAALSDEIARVEVRIAQVWQVLALVGVAYALFLGLPRSPRLAVWGTVAAAPLLVWFAIVAWRIQHGYGTTRLRIASAVVESAIPWICLTVVIVTQGPAYALGSWVPPLFFAALILGSTARLRPVEPLIIGVSSALAYVVVYCAWLRPALPAEVADLPLNLPQVTVTRATSLLMGGVLAMLVASTLRRAIGRADATARERELFGKYRLLRHLASGGMGTVYEALYCPEGGFQRPVAVKRLHPALAQEESVVAFFRNEAELSARLVHPNIVQVHDFGSVDGTWFLAMELVDGVSLRVLMKRAWAAGLTVPTHVIAYLGQEILAGLGYAHAGARAADGAVLRIIHRDVCPSNVLLSRNGEVKLSDFGVARALREARTAHTPTVAGHSSYMAPEQARAQPLDERCDLFAVGIMLWELLCGRQLFYRGSEGPTLLAVLSDEIAKPTTLRPGLEPAWDAFVARALERDPERRFPSAAAMAAALREIPGADGPGAEELCALVVKSLALPDPAPVETAAAAAAAPDGPAGEEKTPPTMRPKASPGGGSP